MVTEESGEEDDWPINRVLVTEGVEVKPAVRVTEKAEKDQFVYFDDELQMLIDCVNDYCDEIVNKDFDNINTVCVGVESRCVQSGKREREGLNDQVRINAVDDRVSDQQTNSTDQVSEKQVSEKQVRVNPVNDRFSDQFIAQVQKNAGGKPMIDVIINLMG